MVGGLQAVMIVPQFLSCASPSVGLGLRMGAPLTVWLQGLVLGAITLAMQALVYGVVALAAGRARAALTGHPGATIWVGRITGAVLILAAALTLAHGLSATAFPHIAKT